MAEDVEKVDPTLIVRDKDGKPHSVRYDQVNAMLLNEFLKEHKKAEGQRSRIEKQEATITELKSNLAAQTMQIQALMSAVQKVNRRLSCSAVDANVIATSQRTAKRKNDKHQSFDCAKVQISLRSECVTPIQFCFTGYSRPAWLLWGG